MGTVFMAFNTKTGAEMSRSRSADKDSKLYEIARQMAMEKMGRAPSARRGLRTNTSGVSSLSEGLKGTGYQKDAMGHWRPVPPGIRRRSAFDDDMRHANKFAWD